MVMLASQSKAKAKKGKTERVEPTEPDRRRPAVEKGKACVACKVAPMAGGYVRCMGCEIELCYRTAGVPGSGGAEVSPAAAPPALPPPVAAGVPSLRPHHVMELRLVAGLSIMLATFSDESFNLRYSRELDEPGPFADPHARYPSWVPEAAGRTYGEFLRYLAELSDRLECATGANPIDDGGETNMDDEFGNPMPAAELYPHKRTESGPQCCPLCAGERTVVAWCEDDGEFDAWTCEECWNDAATAAAVMRRRQAERTPPGSNSYADALAVIEGTPLKSR